MVMTLVGLLPASAAPFPATVSGVVRDARGTPQMGAMVELMAANATVVARAYTNVRGAFTFDQVFPGNYQIKATGESFLPTLREDLRLHARSKVVVNLTLSTLFEAMQWLPAQPRTPDEPSDDWKWTLRSSSNRPLLRLLQDGPLVVLSGDDHGSAPQLAARVAVSGPSREFGQGGPHHAFAIERSSAVGGHLILRANLSPQPEQASEYMAGYNLALGPERQIYNVATVQQMTAIEGGGSQGFYALRLRSAEAVNLGPNASLEMGNEVQSVQGASQITSSLPFVNASWHDDGVSVSYRAATSPEMQSAGDVADGPTLAPMFSEQGARCASSTASIRNCAWKTTPRHVGRWWLSIRMRCRARSSAGAAGYRSRIWPRGHALRSAFPGIPRHRTRLHDWWIHGSIGAKNCRLHLGNTFLR